MAVPCRMLGRPKRHRAYCTNAKPRQCNRILHRDQLIWRMRVCVRDILVVHVIKILDKTSASSYCLLLASGYNYSGIWKGARILCDKRWNARCVRFFKNQVLAHKVDVARANIISIDAVIICHCGAAGTQSRFIRIIMPTCIQISDWQASLF